MHSGPFSIRDHLQRLSAIAQAIASGDHPTAPDLANLASVSRRQALRYVGYLREMGAPIIAEPITGGYRLTRRWDFWKGLKAWAQSSGE